MKITVLGAGLVGGPMALDLAGKGEFDVTVVDIDPGRLQRLSGRLPSLRTVDADVASDPGRVRVLGRDSDMVINAMPGFMGYQTLKSVIEAGKNVIDIAFFPEDPFTLDEMARSRNVTAIMDMGVAPGMCNVLIGYAGHMLDETHDVLYMVGGLPEVRQWPYEYKAVFSPVDVIEEYTRPARFVENGRPVVKPALSDPELLDFPGIGTLEAFNTDGLRSLATTVPCLNMKEKTLRYPGHIEKMRMLRETGFFSQEPVMIGDIPVRPMDLTAKLLFPKWKLEEGETDFTVMKVVVEGMLNGKKTRFTWDLFDRYDPVTGIHSMARTTGYTATMAVRMLAKGLYSHKGVSAPEYLGKDPKIVSFLLEGLRRRGIIYRETHEIL